jgi:hypothetical protein
VFIVAQVGHSYARHLMTQHEEETGVKDEQGTRGTKCASHLLILKVAISSVVLALFVAVESELTACTDLR